MVSGAPDEPEPSEPEDSAPPEDDAPTVLVEGGPREAHALAQRVRDALGRLRAQATADDAAYRFSVM